MNPIGLQNTRLLGVFFYMDTNGSLSGLNMVYTVEVTLNRISNSSNFLSPQHFCEQANSPKGKLLVRMGLFSFLLQLRQKLGEVFQ